MSWEPIETAPQERVPFSENNLPLLPMTHFIAAYLFLSVSSGLVMAKSTWWGDILASQMAGLFWPFIFAARIIQKN